MALLRITDFAGKIMIVEVNEDPDSFNRRIDEAWDSGKYSIKLNGFTRIDVRNIAVIVEIKQNEEPVEQPAEPEEPEPEEPIEG